MEQNKQSLSARQPRKHPVVVVIVAIILALGVGGVAYWYSITNHAPTTSRQTTQNDGNLTPTGTENAITKVVDKVAPSVVSIVTNTTRQTLFGASQGQAAGTGIILSKDGYILTNNHVVASATKIEVVATDGTTYDEVEVVGADPLNDISYLKIKNAKDLQPAELGDSSTLRIGQQVVAIGNALGQYQNTVSSGIISGKGRPITAGGEGGDSGESLTDLLQTDAAINPGNSGGPLLNYSGQVIGINTAVASNAEGIGFAIPVNATKGMLKGVLAGKGVQRSYLGLRYVEITAAVAKQYDLPVKKGAYVAADKGGSAVIADSPAGKAGLQEKDIITKINDEEVGVSGGVSTLVGEYAPGDTVEVTYLRGGAEKRVKVTLATYLLD